MVNDPRPLSSEIHAVQLYILLASLSPSLSIVLFPRAAENSINISKTKLDRFLLQQAVEVLLWVALTYELWSAWNYLRANATVFNCIHAIIGTFRFISSNFSILLFLLFLFILLQLLPHPSRLHPPLLLPSLILLNPNLPSSLLTHIALLLFHTRSVIFTLLQKLLHTHKLLLCSNYYVNPNTSELEFKIVSIYSDKKIEKSCLAPFLSELFQKAK